jgi:hypothetical protein
MAKSKPAAASKEDEKAKVVLSSDILNTALKDHKDEHYNFEETVSWHVSTGSLLLDFATGGVSPSLWRLCGTNNCGKTPQMLEILRNFLRDVSNSKALWVIAEGRGLSEENRARCGLTFVTDPKEWVVGTVFILQTNVFELFIRVIKDLVKNNTEQVRFAFVVDSVDGLILRDDAAKEITESNRVAGVPMLAKKMLQSLSLGMFKYGHWMGLISQVTSEIKIDPYAKSANRGGQFSGGNSLLHGSDVIIQYDAPYDGDFILDNPKGKFNDGKSKSIGQNVRCTLVKSLKESTKKVRVLYPIKFGRKPSGVWIEREVGDLLISWELVKKTSEGSSWLVLDAQLAQEIKEKTGEELPEKVQGEAKLYAMLEDNPKVTQYLFEKFLALTLSATD